jgi:hypothetical protein
MLKALANSETCAQSFKWAGRAAGWASFWLHRVSLMRSPWALRGRGRNINRLSIAYAFRPRLRDRLTLRGMTFRRKPWAYGEGDSHPLYRYSFQHNHLDAVQHSFPYAFNPHPTLLYHV